MARGLIGKKIGMSQIFDKDGNLVPVTILEMTPNKVVQVKTAEGKDGYNAIKVGFGETNPKKINRPDHGVYHRAGLEPMQLAREFRVAEGLIGNYEVGQELTVAMFEAGEAVDVTGISKGRGYQGVIKRHGFKGAKESSHGTHEYKRHAGSIGCSAYPGRVIKGKKMAGRMGNDRVTTRALKIMAVFPDRHVMMIKGPVPGAKNSLVAVRVSAKQPDYI